MTPPNFSRSASNVDVAIARLEQRMLKVEEGVSNFRNFQSEASIFFADHKAREDEKDKTDKRRARIHFALLTAVLTILTGIAIALFNMWAGNHKIVTVEQHAITSHQPEDAKVPAQP